MSPTNSTRWCPTPEQVMILEEMYREGVRTPNASQIQKITAHLSFYGRIEGKNVFYWFQNHKARERQKLRRKLYQQQLFQDQFHLHHYHHHHPNNNFHSLFNNNASSPNPPMHKSVDYLHQGVGATEMKNYSTWRQLVDPPNKYEMPNCMMRNCCDEWVVMNMKDDAPYSFLPCCSNNKPLKTLQLFPISTNATAAATTSDQPDCQI